MSMKWWTAFLSRTRSAKDKGARLMKGVAVLLVAVMLAGCALLPDEPVEEDLSDIQLPQISKKPEYEVTTKTLETKVSASGRILTAKEKTMYFTLDNRRIKKLYIQSGQEVTAGQPLAELDVDDLRQQLRTEQLAMKQRELQMKEMLRNRDEMDPVEFEQAVLSFEEMRQKLADMEADIAKATLVAEFDGTIVSVSVQEGDMVKAYDPVCVIADPSQKVVAATLTQSDLNRVSVGMEAVVDIGGVGKLNGKVMQMPAPRQSGSNEPARLDQYMLVDVPDLPETVERGTPLSVSVIINRKMDAVVIPLAALRSIGGRTYVQVAEADGSKREVDVEVGMQTATEVEILQGLAPGQKVVGR